MPSPDQIFRQLKKKPRNPQLWDELYDLLEPRLHQYTSNLLRRVGTDTADADDVVQDILLRLIEDFSKITRDISTFVHLRNYLIKACRNRVLEQHRNAQLRASKEEILSLKFEDLVSHAFLRQFQEVENREFIEELLKKLNSRCENLVRSFLLSQQSLTDYAAESGIKLGTIYSQWKRCIQELKNIVAPDARKSDAEA